MRRNNSYLLALLVPLVAASSVVQEEDVQKGSAEKLESTRAEIRQLEVVLDSQVRDIAKLTNEEEAVQAEKDLAQWRIDRERRCDRVSRDEAGDLAELELLKVQCILDMTKDRFDDLETRISELEIDAEQQ